MRDGFIKVAAGTPKIRVADCRYNAVSLADGGGGDKPFLSAENLNGQVRKRLFQGFGRIFLINGHKARAKLPRLGFQKLYISPRSDGGDFYSKMLRNGAGLAAYASGGTKNTDILHHNYYLSVSTSVF